MFRPEPDRADHDVTRVFAALGDPIRMELVARLGENQPLSIARLAEGLALSRQGVTKHIAVLERAGLVTSRRSGRERHYVGVPQAIDRARTHLGQVSAQWDAALLRLKEFVEE